MVVVAVLRIVIAWAVAAPDKLKLPLNVRSFVPATPKYAF
jgi:hypothetical protein